MKKKKSKYRLTNKQKLFVRTKPKKDRLDYKHFLNGVNIEIEIFKDVLKDEKI